MAAARVGTSEHFTECLGEKKEKIEVCFDIGLGVCVARSPLSYC